MTPKNFMEKSRPDIAGLTILVLEDHEDSRELLVTLLEHRRAKTIPAATTDAAFDLLKSHLPHVIVSDIGLPGEDGVSFMDKIRRLPASEGGATPAIALSAFSGDEARQRALSSGFHVYLTKPVQIDALVEAVEVLAKLAPSSKAHEPREC